ncbi:MAG TPA: D-alanine--D-alanine ligase [Bacteroidales bacterium]|nr:D-alanine--D-alanine ligase [Bacteroidales bacterium]
MRLNVAVLTGGSSGELEISLQSAQQVYTHLDRKHYQPFLIIVRSRDWVCLIDGIEYPVDKTDFTLSLPDEKIVFDCIFLVIHGTPGEDGKLQGYFDLLGIPYTSCNSIVSGVTFSKYFSNHVAAQAGIAVPITYPLVVGEQLNHEYILSVTGLPCFVKPSKSGSSVGVSKVSVRNTLQAALDFAFSYDDEVLVQEALNGREITCGIMRYKNEVIIFPLCEIVSKREFFDYEAKYTPEMAEEIVPAMLTETLASKCRDISAKLYTHFRCKGVVRFDYILVGQTYYFLEVNTIPGLTQGSIVPRMASAKGLTMSELFGMLVEDAMFIPS